jgi:hypothetical protein
LIPCSRCINGRPRVELNVGILFCFLLKDKYMQSQF